MANIMSWSALKKFFEVATLCRWQGVYVYACMLRCGYVILGATPVATAVYVGILCGQQCAFVAENVMTLNTLRL